MYVNIYIHTYPIPVNEQADLVASFVTIVTYMYYILYLYTYNKGTVLRILFLGEYSSLGRYNDKLRLTTLSEALSFYLSQQAIYVVRVYRDPFCQI